MPHNQLLSHISRTNTNAPGRCDGADPNGLEGELRTLELRGAKKLRFGATKTPGVYWTS